jgi:hypothetical protein
MSTSHTPPQPITHHFQTRTGSRAITPMNLETTREPPTTIQEQPTSVVQSQPDEPVQVSPSRASTPREEAESLVEQLGYPRFDRPRHRTYQILNNTRRQYEAGTLDEELAYLIETTNLYEALVRLTDGFRANPQNRLYESQRQYPGTTDRGVLTPPDLDTPSRPPRPVQPTRGPRDMAPLFQVVAQSLQNFANPVAPDERPAIISRIPRYTAPRSSWPTWTQPATTPSRALPHDPVGTEATLQPAPPLDILVEPF